MRSLKSHAVGEIVEPPYFEGVYDEEPRDLGEDPWQSEGWQKSCEHYARKLGLGAGYEPAWRSFLRGPTASRLLKWVAFGHPNFPRHLTDIKSLLATATTAGSVRVLDVGGGFGDNYCLLGYVLTERQMALIDYHVVDNELSIDLGRRLYHGQQRAPTFHSSIPATAEFDVTLLVGTLHYIGDWRSALDAVRRRTRRHVVITRSPISPSRSFFTTQTICPPLGPLHGRKAGTCAVTVISEGDLIAHMVEGARWVVTTRRLLLDYSDNFRRLPESHRPVAYVTFVFGREQHR